MELTRHTCEGIIIRLESRADAVTRVSKDASCEARWSPRVPDGKWRLGYHLTGFEVFENEELPRLNREKCAASPMSEDAGCWMDLKSSAAFQR